MGMAVLRAPGVRNPLKSSVTDPSFLVNCYLEIKFHKKNQGEPPSPLSISKNQSSLEVYYDLDCCKFDVNIFLRYYFEGLQSLETASSTLLKKCAAESFVFLCKLHYKNRQIVFSWPHLMIF